MKREREKEKKRREKELQSSVYYYYTPHRKKSLNAHAFANLRRFNTNLL
jgi:hypothetical protein